MNLKEKIASRAEPIDETLQSYLKVKVYLLQASL